MDIPMKRFTYACLVGAQRPDTPIFCMFQAPVGEVLAWATIKRLEDDPRAPQRPANQARIRAIKKFLELDARNTIPTAVILTLKIKPTALETVTCDGGESMRRITFEIADPCPEGDRPGLVIDGQHRLLGTNLFDPAMKIGVVALVNAEDIETAFQFMVINNKASKVPGDHIRALSLNYNDDELEARLRTARLSLSRDLPMVKQADTETESPFLNLINWPNNRTGIKMIVPAAVEIAAKDIRLLEPIVFENDDTLVEFFFAMWRAIKALWPDLWVAESKLMSNVGIVCMNRYVANSLVKLADWGQLDLNDAAAVESKTTEFLAHQDRAFWTATWTSTSYDTRVGHQVIVDALEAVNRNIRNGVPWSKDIPLIDQSNA